MKNERIYRELLLSALSDVYVVKQKQLAERCGTSIGLVNKTVRKPDPGHLFRFSAWEGGEGAARLAILTAFSGWVSLTGSRPTEYSSVYFYVSDREMFLDRFEPRKQGCGEPTRTCSFSTGRIRT